MIIPIKRLPLKIMKQGCWRVIYDKHNNHFLAGDPENDYNTIGHSISELLYVVDAANNFPKAIELLEYFVNRVEKGTIRSKTTYAKYKEFLNSLK